MKVHLKFGKIFLLTTFTSLAMLPTACQKETVVATNSTESVEKIAQLFAKQGVKTEQFTLSAQIGGSITSAQGTTFNIPENAFVDKKQQLVTGDVTILVKEIHKVSDMLFSNKPTVTAKGELLTSFGEFYIGANQKEPLELAAGKTILATRPFISMNGIAKSEVKNWFGDNSNARKGMEWLPMQANLGKLGKNKALEMVIRSLQWCNWDVILKEKYGEKRTTLSVGFESNFNPKTNLEDNKEGVFLSGVYFKPNNENSLFKCYEFLNKEYLEKHLNQKGDEIFGLGTYSYGDIIPVGMQGKILAYSIIDEQYFVEVKDVTIEEGGFVTVNPQLVKEDEFIQAVESLNEK